MFSFYYAFYYFHNNYWIGNKMSVEQIANQCKKYYIENNIDPKAFPMNHKIASLIASEKPGFVMEFGCNNAVNLKIIKSMRPKCIVAGVDINTQSIAKAVVNVQGNFAVGDEDALKYVEKKSYDVVFTCSVLDHMPYVLDVIRQFKRIAKQSIFVCETQEVLSKYYFAHNYKSMGFKKIHSMKSVGDSLGNNALYEIWKYDC